MLGHGQFGESEFGKPILKGALQQRLWQDGIVNLDTPDAKRIGFTSDKYEGYLWKIGDAVMVSFIVSKQRGNFLELVRRIHALGLTVKVPIPLARMQEIVMKNGYTHTTEPFDQEPDETVDVWVLPPPTPAV